MPQDGPADGPPCRSCGEPQGPEQTICGPCLLSLRLDSHEWRRQAAIRPGDRPGESALDVAKRLAQG